MLDKKKKKLSFIEKNKLYKNLDFSIDNYINENFEVSDNNITIYLKCNNKDDLYSQFCTKSHQSLNQELCDYIERIIYDIPLRYSVTLKVITEELGLEEKLKAETIFKNHYKLILYDKNLDLKINSAKAISLFCVGSILLVIYFALNILNYNIFITEFLSISGTFALWETVDLFLLERKKLDIDRLNAGQLSDMKIEFCSYN